MNFIAGIVKVVQGGYKDGAYVNQAGKFKALVLVEEDQSWTDKKGEARVWMANIPFTFFGKEAERLAQDPDHYIGRMVKIDFQLGGYNPPDKPGVWFGNINGRFIHSNENSGEAKKETSEIPF
jgi:hypothetical protein